MKYLKFFEELDPDTYWNAGYKLREKGYTDRAKSLISYSKKIRYEKYLKKCEDLNLPTFKFDIQRFDNGPITSGDFYILPSLDDDSGEMSLMINLLPSNKNLFEEIMKEYDVIMLTLICEDYDIGEGGGRLYHEAFYYFYSEHSVDELQKYIDGVILGENETIFEIDEEGVSAAYDNFAIDDYIFDKKLNEELRYQTYINAGDSLKEKGYDGRADELRIHANKREHAKMVKKAEEANLPIFDINNEDCYVVIWTGIEDPDDNEFDYDMVYLYINILPLEYDGKSTSYQTLLIAFEFSILSEVDLSYDAFLKSYLRKINIKNIKKELIDYIISVINGNTPDINDDNIDDISYISDDIEKALNEEL